MNSFAYYEPKTVTEASVLLQKENYHIIAGGTDLMVQASSGLKEPAGVINIKKIPDLSGIYLSAGQLVIGALTPLSEIAVNVDVRGMLPALALGARSVGTPQIRNRGTIGGNLCNSSPCADTAPGCITGHGVLHIVSETGKRNIPVNDLFIGPRNNSLKPGEIVTAITFPIRTANFREGFIKHGPRKAADIAVISVAISMDLERGICRNVRIVCGSVGPTPLRIKTAEALIEGKVLNSIRPSAAAKETAEHVRPISDVRSSLEYRKEMVRVRTEELLIQLIEGDQNAD